MAARGRPASQQERYDADRRQGEEQTDEQHDVARWWRGRLAQRPLSSREPELV